jgi:uncharacterized membrane protein YsdA (DUF1294 family)/cold shock CspA family protein
VRHQGKVSRWKDEQGFGFIAPNGGGQPVFVHIKSFSNRQQRPAGNEIVTYELSQDARGRPQAGSVAFVGRRVPQATPSGSGRASLMVSMGFVILVAGASLAGKMPVAVLWLYLAASLVAFAAYALDKSAAKNDRWRTPERTLHFFALAGGWPGALAAQGLLRHKSRKPSFQLVFWATVILNFCALAWLLTASGAPPLRATLATA